LFRSIELPDNVRGKIYLHSMPGRYEPLEQLLLELSNKGIQMVISLASMDEIRAKAPDYAKAIATGAMPFERISFPIKDFSVPKDKESYLQFVRKVAKYVKAGESILIHCGAGKGRTGTVAASVLLALGFNKSDALERIQSAGSYPETTDQAALIDWIADQLD